jgi:hypothetical protein
MSGSLFNPGGSAHILDTGSFLMRGLKLAQQLQLPCPQLNFLRHPRSAPLDHHLGLTWTYSTGPKAVTHLE